jgi:hypothetical protein
MSESSRVEYLLRCSKPSLESFELSRLNRVANLRKELRMLVEAWIEAEVEARLAHWVLEHHCGEDNQQDLIVIPETRSLGHAIRRRKFDPRSSLPRKASARAERQLIAEIHKRRRTALALGGTLSCAAERTPASRVRSPTVQSARLFLP